MACSCSSPRPCPLPPPPPQVLNPCPLPPAPPTPPGGPFILPLAEQYGVKLLPADSEHSAIFQCMQGLPQGGMRRIILTASGGAFRDWPVEKLKQVGGGEGHECVCGEGGGRVYLCVRGEVGRLREGGLGADL